jgi:hypothetical protein
VGSIDWGDEALKAKFCSRSATPPPIPQPPPSIHQQQTNQELMNITISFSPDGTAQCLWTEVLPLHELGRLEITRASNIEFNNATQQWEVKDRRRRGKVRFISRSRSACLEWEQENLQPD